VTGGFGATVPDVEDWVRVADHTRMNHQGCSARISIIDIPRHRVRRSAFIVDMEKGHTQK